MGDVNNGLYMLIDLHCGSCKNNYVDHLCMRIYGYRKMCFYCLKKIIENQKVSRYNFYTKRYNIYGEKQMEKSKK